MTNDGEVQAGKIAGTCQFKLRTSGYNGRVLNRPGCSIVNRWHEVNVFGISQF